MLKFSDSIVQILIVQFFRTKNIIIIILVSFDTSSCTQKWVLAVEIVEIAVGIVEIAVGIVEIAVGIVDVGIVVRCLLRTRRIVVFVRCWVKMRRKPPALK